MSFEMEIDCPMGPSDKCPMNIGGQCVMNGLKCIGATSAELEEAERAPIIWCHHEKDYILRAQCGECEECDDDQVTTLEELERWCDEQNANLREADNG